MCYVYFASGVDDMVKIGFASDPKQRISQARTWSPHNIRIIDCFKVSSRDAEGALHGFLEPYHVNREWFSCLDLAEGIAEELDDYRMDIWLQRRIGAGLPFDADWPGLEDVDCTPAIRKIIADGLASAIDCYVPTRADQDGDS